MVVVKDSDDLHCWKKLDRFLEKHVLNFKGHDQDRSCYTYPSKSQGHLKHEVGGEYN